MVKHLKLLFYLCGLLLFLGSGMAISYFRILPVRNTSVFLFSLLWIWVGLSGLLGLNPRINSENRRFRIIYCLAVIGLGAVWFPLSMLPQSHEAVPVILATAPFLTVVVVSKFVLSETSQKIKDKE